MLGVQVREDACFYHPTFLPAGGFLATGRGVCRRKLGRFLQLSHAAFGAGRTQLAAQKDLGPQEQLRVSGLSPGSSKGPLWRTPRNSERRKTRQVENLCSK